MSDESPIADNEAVYDDQIFPLMAQIIEICKAHKIPMMASFEYAPEQLCSTHILPKGSSRNLDAAVRAIHTNPNFVAFTVRNEGKP